ncbi:hypothetical protein OG216_23955 [Streptomycetaceae bacterium NBC_01309]
MTPRPARPLLSAPAPRTPARPVPLALVPVLLLLAVLLAVVCGGTAASAAPAADSDADHVVFVGVPGLLWSDITPEGTPNLAALTGRSSSAALSVRTVEKTTCPTDGWLTVGSGARSTAKRTDGACGPLPAPAMAADGTLTVPDLPRIADHNDKYSYDPQFGSAASAAVRAGMCVTAVGPGAAVATADADGRSPAGYLADPAALDRAAMTRCALTVVDLGAVAGAEPGADGSGTPGRLDRMRAVDAAVGRIAAELPPRAELVVAGIADDGATPHLRVLLASGPDGRFGSGLLTSTSTRYDGMAQLTDIAPSLLAPLGVAKPDKLVGAAVTRTGGPTGPAAVAELDRLDIGAQAARTVREEYQFYTWLTLVPILLFACGIAGAVRMRRRGAEAATRRRLYRGLQGVAIAAGSVPAATFLVGLFPWTEAGNPEAATIGISLAGAAVLTALALAGPWRRHPYGPAGFVAAATFVILAGDVVTGSHLQMNTLFGLSPLVAGRFYGFGNVAWSVYGMAVLLAAAWPVGHLLAKAGRRPEPGAATTPAPAADADASGRRTAMIVLGVCALVAIVVDGWPAFGSDFGGVLALVPGFAVLGLLLTGTRISWAKVGLVALTAVVVVGVIAVLDWMRPDESRSHLGRFVQDVVDGEAGTVLRRKIMDNLGSFDNVVSFLIPVLMALLLVAVLAPPRLRATALPPAYARVPWLRPVLISCWVTAVVGYAVNDSGIQIPSIALLIAVPLGAAVLASVAAEDASGTRAGGLGDIGGGAASRAQAEPHGAE